MKYVLGYTIHSHKFYTESAIVFSKDSEKIRVSDVLHTIDLVLSFIATFDTSIHKYKVALKAFNAAKLIFTNKKPSSFFPTKEELGLVVDVYEEFANFMAQSDEAKKGNAQAAFICKLLIGGMDE